WKHHPLSCSPLIYSDCSSNMLPNIALKGKATQSSTGYTGQAMFAVDGNSDTNYGHGTCTHTVLEKDPWWRVELPHTYSVDMVTITNRGDCCEERINGAQIRIGNSLENNGNNNHLVATIGSLQSGATETYKFAPVKGRFVNIVIPGHQKYLTLCEVKVFEGENLNLALRGTATQSSLHSLAQKAVDGNRNFNLKNGFCTYTALESAPWWRVDLHHTYTIHYVALTNQGDCCSYCLNGAEIRIGDSLQNDGKDNPLCATVSSIPPGQTEYFVCTKFLKGRYMTAVLPRVGILSLCEMEVFGQ
uniref:Fucolectin tachylectin-4 pentraxin-1 domain-containing protein n=1 Tax=Electrophorus electricus TaxID=8005 RepID=A0A4W4FNV0_ELEEL